MHIHIHSRIYIHVYLYKYIYIYTFIFTFMYSYGQQEILPRARAIPMSLIWIHQQKAVTEWHWLVTWACKIPQIGVLLYFFYPEKFQVATSPAPLKLQYRVISGLYQPGSKDSHGNPTVFCFASSRLSVYSKKQNLHIHVYIFFFVAP